MTHNIYEPVTFTKQLEAEGKPAIDALAQAAQWLDDKRLDGWEPASVFCVGTTGKCVLSGDVSGRSNIVFRHVSKPKVRSGK